jgi:hypothetical protein
VSKGATTPEELEQLLEDTIVLRDAAGLAPLFGDGAVLALADAPGDARGREEIARLVATQWQLGRTYVAHPGRVIQARDTALVVGDRGLHVTRREPDGCWRYAISLLSLENDSEEER